MRKYLAVALIVPILSSCAYFTQSSNPSRGISSIETQLSTLQVEDIKSEVAEKLEQIEYMHLMAYETMAQFDLYLDTNPGELQDNPHYPALLAARSQIEGLQDEIIDLRDQFYKASINESLPVEDRLKSVDMLSAILPETDNSINRLVFFNLISNYELFTKVVLNDLSKIEDESVKRKMEKFYNKLSFQFGPLKEKSDEAQDWKILTSKARAALADKPEWQAAKRNLEHMAQEVRFELIQLNKMQKSGANKFYPTVEKAGNIVGTEFPAKVWSLTFDDGPGPKTSKKVIDNLKTHGLKATFFQLTQNAKSFGVAAKMIRDEGMDIASHSYSHPQVPKLSLEQRDREIRIAASDLSIIHGRPMKFFRLPYGAGVSNTDIRTRIANANMIHVFWSVDTLDWMAQAPSEIVARAKKQILASSRDAGVILFHDIHERTVIASEEVMRFLKQDSRRVCTLDQIVEAMNRGETPCPAP
ncbi:MAG: polysaccharide deacetylase family protein [Bacteriovoracaceae bacterium]|nr:polysaccharide deacetylase family protein [Bacteriovoracaceae bacterium]